MVIPQWISSLITDKDVEALEQKIARIENLCDVEIVPVIVRSSSNYPQTRITLALVMLLLMLGLWSALGLHWHWDGMVLASIYLGVVSLMVFVGAPLLARFGWVQMVMSHKDLEREQCWKRSEIEFYSGRISKTKHENGLLIYISLLEHRVIVKGDESIYKKLEESVWDEAVQKIIQGIRKKQMAQGLSDALDMMENLLKVHFPVTANKQNEVPNTLIIKE